MEESRFSFFFKAELSKIMVVNKQFYSQELGWNDFEERHF